MDIYDIGTVFVYNSNNIIYIQLLEAVRYNASHSGIAKILYSTNKYHNINMITSGFIMNHFSLATEEEINKLNKLLTFQ